MRTSGWPRPDGRGRVAAAGCVGGRRPRRGVGSDRITSRAPGFGRFRWVRRPCGCPPSGGALISSHAVASRSSDALLHRVRVKGQQLDAAEPTLGLTRKGDLYYTAFQSNIRIEVLKSRDEGRSWRIVSPDLGARNAHLLSFDPHLYVDSRPRASSI
jgi:hypothetical protein